MGEYCRQPFTAIEIGDNGNVYTCCPSFIKYFKIGNIFEANAEEIWHGELACKLREKILKNDYSLCNKDICRQFHLKEFSDTENMLKPPFPLYITLAYDRECNLNCITCRDEKYRNPKEKIDIFNERIETVLIPLLQNADILALSGGGEAIYSSHSRLLIKKIAQANKKLLFNINTNGLLFNEENLKTLGIYGRINEIFVSLPSVDKRLYNRIMLGSDYKTVIKNIKWMAAEQNKSINKVTINSVISRLNYKEIPKLVKFAKDLNIFITLSPFDDWGTKFAKEYDYAVWQETNRDYKNLVKILNKLPDYERIYMPKLFDDLRKH